MTRSRPSAVIGKARMFAQPATSFRFPTATAQTGSDTERMPPKPVEEAVEAGIDGSLMRSACQHLRWAPFGHIRLASPTDVRRTAPQSRVLVVWSTVGAGLVGCLWCGRVTVGHRWRVAYNPSPS